MDATHRIYRNEPHLRFANSAAECLTGADALIMVTEWKVFRSHDFDGRNLYAPQLLRSMGIEYLALGR